MAPAKTWLLLVDLGSPPSPSFLETGMVVMTAAGADVVEAVADPGLLWPPGPPVMEVTELGRRSFSAPEGAMPRSPGVGKDHMMHEANVGEMIVHTLNQPQGAGASSLYVTYVP